MGSCKTLNDLSVFNLITGINESKKLTKHISFEFNSRKCNSNQKWNNGKCWYECKNSKKFNPCQNDS